MIFLMVTWLTETSLQWLACLIVVLPLVGIAIWQERKKGGGSSLWYLALLGGFFFISLALARSTSYFSWLPSPWQGMVFEAIFALVVILVTRTVQSSGLSLKINRKAWRDAAIATGLLLLFVVVRNAGLRWLNLGEAGNSPGGAYLLYLAIMPGIAEELVYRGVIQSRLNKLFPVKWKIAGARLGWGFVITAILFWSIHAFRVEGGALSFHWQTLTLPLIVGIVLGWMRERSGSIWPGVIAHNLVNLVWLLT